MPKFLSFYLPQYHPIPENDQWWGKGFTEWTNVTKAKPLFKGHQQPRFPADLSYYDLRIPEVREQQAEMAKAHGIDGFVYYHYWFGNGRQLIERPFNEVLNSGKPDFPFCLCWANQTWSGIWHGTPNRILIEQTYPGIEDTKNHFTYLFKAFKDPRYIRIEGKPLFMVYDVHDLPEPREFSDTIKKAAVDAGLPGVYLMVSNLASDDWDFKGNGFDGKVSNAFNKSMHQLIGKVSGANRFLNKFKLSIKSKPKAKVLNHKELVLNTEFKKSNVHTYPIVVPNWDNTPRSGERGIVFTGSTPEVFEQQLQKSFNFLKEHEVPENLIFVKSWNEWAEGNYLEPDTVTGYKFLEVIKRNTNFNYL